MSNNNNNTINILYLIDNLGIGGSQSIVKGILESHLNYNIFLYVLRKREPELTINNGNIFSFQSNSRFSLLPIFDLRKLILNKHISVLHCHLFRSQVFGWILKTIFFPNITLIFHEHGQVLDKKKWHHFFLKRIKKNVDTYIAVSKVVKKELIDSINVDTDKIELLYNFIQFKSSPFPPPTNVKMKKDNFTIGFVGRINKEKGCKYAISSLKYLKFKAKLLIAGDGPERKQLEKLVIKLDLKSQVTFLGFVENIIKIYSLIDVLVVPSERESFGKTAIEAQYFNIPVIVSNVGGLKEIVQNAVNGLIFESKNAEDLAEKINIVKKQKNLRNRLIENGKKNADKYSLNNYLHKLHEIYSQYLKAV